MKSKIISVLLLCIPVMMFASAYQAFRFVQQENLIRALDREQRSLIEANKRAVAEISMLKSPGRIRQIAGDDARFAEGYPDEIIYILRSEAPRD